MSHRFQITLAGRTFECLPERKLTWLDDFVYHQGKKYLSVAGRYPIQVLASVAADTPQQIVLFKTADKIYAIQADTQRIVSFDLGDEILLSRSINRLMITSSSEDIIVFEGDYRSVPTHIVYKKVDALNLPRIHKPKSLYAAICFFLSIPSALMAVKLFI